jgi:RNA polymerase sigma-70 factor (ECF subfamily)
MEEGVALLEKLHRRYAGVLYDKCLRMLSDEAEAEDALQETFVIVYRHIDEVSRFYNPLPWLYRVTTTTCLKFLRTRRRKSTLPLSEPDLLSQAFCHPDRRLISRQVLDRLIDTLDERNQILLVAYYLDGMDQSQIATALGISRRATVKRLARLRCLVDSLLEEG